MIFTQFDVLTYLYKLLFKEKSIRKHQDAGISFGGKYLVKQFLKEVI